MRVMQTNLVSVQVNQASSAKVPSRITIEQNSTCSEIWQAIKRALSSIRDAFMRICNCSKNNSQKPISPPVINNVSSPAQQNPLAPPADNNVLRPAQEPRIRNQRLLDELYEAAVRNEQQSEIEALRLGVLRSEVTLLEQQGERIWETINQESRQLAGQLANNNVDRRQIFSGPINRGRLELEDLEHRVNVRQKIEDALQALQRADEGEARAKEALAAYEQEVGSHEVMRQRARGARLNAIEANYHAIQFDKMIALFAYTKACLSSQATVGTEFDQRAQAATAQAFHAFSAMGRYIQNEAMPARSSGHLEDLRNVKREITRFLREIQNIQQTLNDLGEQAIPFDRVVV